MIDKPCFKARVGNHEIHSSPLADCARRPQVLNREAVNINDDENMGITFRAPRWFCLTSTYFFSYLLLCPLGQRLWIEGTVEVFDDNILRLTVQKLHILSLCHLAAPHDEDSRPL